jgi:hypothetical protein
MWKGHMDRVMDQEDMLAKFAAPICSSAGHGAVHPPQLLGRPFRYQMKELEARKADVELSARDRERLERLKAGKPLHATRAG